MDPCAVATPLVRLPDDDLCFAFNLIRIPSPADLPTGWSRRTVRSTTGSGTSGGTLYPVSAFPLSPTDWRDHFGPVSGVLREVKERFDPDMLLTPGYEIFAS